METGHIILIFVGLAVLMILFKALFGQTRPASHQMPSAAATELQEAGRRMGAVAKQASLFAEAAMLLPREIGFQSDRARLGTGFFIAGATDCLAQKHGLNDIEYASVLVAILQQVGLMTEPQANQFVDSLPQASLTKFGRDAMIKGGSTITDWLGGKDDNAPVRLLTYIEEWSADASDA